MVYTTALTPVLIIGFLFLLLFILSCCFIAFSEVKDIKIKRFNIDEKNEVQKSEFTDEIQGISVVFFSDLHIGKLLQKEELTAKIQFLADLQADLYIFGGDLIGRQIKQYYTPDEIKECFAPLLKKTTLAVYGNHEFNKDKQITADEKMKYFQAMGFHILCNESFEYEKNGQKLVIFGMQDAIYHPLIKELPPCDLVVAHEADPLLDFSSSFISLSGHTHGGQIRLPFLPFYYRPAKGRKMTTGLYHKKNKQLLLSNGLGCNGIKVRFFAPCDIIMLDYRRKEK